MADQTALLVDPEVLMSIALHRSDRPRRIDRVIDYFGDRRDGGHPAPDPWAERGHGPDLLGIHGLDAGPRTTIVETEKCHTILVGVAHPL